LESSDDTPGLGPTDADVVEVDVDVAESVAEVGSVVASLLSSSFSLHEAKVPTASVNPSARPIRRRIRERGSTDER
jgi:hypothetical protein